MSKCLSERLLHVHCRHHKVDLVENEHYDDWFLCLDLSGFYCPTLSKNENATDEEMEACSNSWAISPIGRDDIDLIELSTLQR